MNIVVINHLTLDGVMQAPGDINEDRRGNFQHGGWAAPRNDPAMFTAMGERMMKPDSALLLGRFSYDSMLGGWNRKGGPFKDSLNNFQKYVASRNPNAELPWPNSHLVSGDVPSAIAELKRKPGGNLVMMGSGMLIQSLIPRDLIDEYLLMIHPIVLGSGGRLFAPDGPATELRLTESSATASGVILGTFVPARNGS